MHWAHKMPTLRTLESPFVLFNHPGCMLHCNLAKLNENGEGKRCNTFLCRCTICEGPELRNHSILKPAVSPMLSLSPSALSFLSFFFFLGRQPAIRLLYREMTGRGSHPLGNTYAWTRAERAIWGVDCKGL